jgi:hypothetical protein
MKQANYQQTKANTDETLSNNENNKKQKTTKEYAKKLLRHKASARKRTKHYGPETASFQYS